LNKLRPAIISPPGPHFHDVRTSELNVHDFGTPPLHLVEDVAFEEGILKHILENKYENIYAKSIKEAVNIVNK
jgi:hypothetical protein